nr:MAG TPA: hypothetical protein [Inoviridae sp.]
MLACNGKQVAPAGGQACSGGNLGTCANLNR